LPDTSPQLGIKVKRLSLIAHARRALKTFSSVPIWFHLGGLTAMSQSCIEMLQTQRGTTLEKEARG
jgi:hypothetical protein